MEGGRGEITKHSQSETNGPQLELGLILRYTVKKETIEPIHDSLGLVQNNSKKLDKAHTGSLNADRPRRMVHSSRLLL